MQGKSDPNVELLDAAALCRHLVADDSVHAFLADHRWELFPDELFADLFPSGRGRPSIPADVIATVMVLQSLEGLVGWLRSDKRSKNGPELLVELTGTETGRFEKRNLPDVADGWQNDIPSR